MPSIASLVPKLRPTLIGAALLAVAAFALRDGHHRRHDCGRPHVTVATLEGSLRRAPMTLDWSAPAVDPWDVPARPFGTIVPPRHPDARPWPHGMVIGTPPIDSAIVVWDFSPLDNMLSAFVAGLRALES